MEEWKEYKLGDVLCIKYGKDHKLLASGSIPIYGSGGIMRYADRSIYEGPSILIPRKGSLNNIMYSDKPFWTVDTMFWTTIYNRQNELCIFLKRKVHFFDTISHENEQLISQLLIFYNRAFLAAFQAYFNALSMSFQIQCKSVEPQKSFSKTNQA